MGREVVSSLFTWVAMTSVPVSNRIDLQQENTCIHAARISSNLDFLSSGDSHLVSSSKTAPLAFLTRCSNRDVSSRCGIVLDRFSSKDDGEPLS